MEINHSYAMKIKLAVLAIVSLGLTACAQLNIPLGAQAKYGTLTVGYIPPTDLPFGVTPTLKDK